MPSLSPVATVALVVLYQSGCSTSESSDPAMRDVNPLEITRQEISVTPENVPSRRIVYEAEIELKVTEFSMLEAAIPRLADKCGGYIAQAEIGVVSGEQRVGTWRARVPQDRYEAFVDEVVLLGVPIGRSQKAQDVTEEYVDLETRIANKKRLEERVLELLGKLEGEVDEIMRIERELARVRGEVEQMEGKLRYLANRTDLATVEIEAHEEKESEPVAAPTFGTRISTAWHNSLQGLRQFGAGLIVILVSLVPWIVSLALFVALPLWAGRWWLRRQSVSAVEIVEGG